MKVKEFFPAKGCAGLIVLMLCAVVAVAQQTTADILGTVTDPSGALVAGANVTVENLGTHERRQTETTSAGEYVVNLLNPGSYSITIKRAGFESFRVPSVTLAAGDRFRANAAMAVGSQEQTVTVESEATALQTDSSVLGTNISQQTTQDLPLNGRNFVQLVQLLPGANEGPPGGLISGKDLDDQRQSASISINGQDETLNNNMIDGADNYERLIGTIAVRPSIDAISETSVQSNTYTAEVGRTGGGIINVITKGGANSFHGDLFEYFRNDVLNTYDYAVGGLTPGQKKSEWRQNQYGGSLGGPVKKNKLFFFGSYEGYRLVQGIAPSVSPDLSDAELAEAKAGEPLDFTDRSPLDPNSITFGPPVIPTTKLDPTGLAYLKMLAAPNTTEMVLGNDNATYVQVPAYSGGPIKTQNNTVYDARVDYNMDANNSMYGRFIYNKALTKGYAGGAMPKATVDGLTLEPSIGSTANDTDFDFLANYIHTFNQRLVMELKAAYTRANNQSYPLTEGLNPMTVFNGRVNNNINSNLYGADATGLALVINVNGWTEGGVIVMPVKDMDNTFQYMGALTYTHGNQNIKAGASLIRRQLTSFQSTQSEGLWVFLNYATLAQGLFITNGGRAMETVAPHLRAWEPSVYVQDDWHFRKNLTLNLGLRYDVFTPYTEIANRISTWDPNSASLWVAGVNGVSNTAGVQTDYHGLAPRFGFAYSAGHDLVVRGGYGIGYYPMNSTSNANMKDPPFVATSQACSSLPGIFGGSACGSGLSSFSGGLPTPVPASITQPGATIPDAVSPHFRTSYVQQFNVTVQKEWGGNVVTGSYVGLLGRQLAQLMKDLNAAPPADYSAMADPDAQNEARPYYSKYPDLGLIGFFKTGGNSTFNALETSFERRLKHGLAVNANYTWAHGLTNATGLSFENAAGYSDVPSATDTLDYGNSPIDYRHRIAGTANYQLPFGKNAQGAMALLTKGWQTNLIQVWMTGGPFTVVNNSSVSQAISGYDDRPNQTGKWRLSNPTIGSFFNTKTFQPQAPGTVGSERMNQLYGPHWRHTDLSLFKTFPIHEQLNAEFRAEAFNLTNTSNWDNPQATLGGAGFGAVTDMNYNYTPRVLQFALKLTF